MEYIVHLAKTKLIGLSLSHKTTNTNGQSGIDCGQLWHKFESGAYANKIPRKLSDEIIAVYHQYEGDHTQAFAYFIGCRVAENTESPPEMETLTLPAGKYIKLTAQGIIPDCIADTWKKYGKRISKGIIGPILKYTTNAVKTGKTEK